MNKKWVIVIIIVAMLATAGLIVFKTQKKMVTRVIDTNMVVKGDFIIAPNQEILLKNAQLVIEGDVVIDGELDCQGGALRANVKKNLIVKKKINCVREG